MNMGELVFTFRNNSDKFSNVSNVKQFVAEFEGNEKNVKLLSYKKHRKSSVDDIFDDTRILSNSTCKKVSAIRETLEKSMNQQYIPTRVIDNFGHSLAEVKSALCKSMDVLNEPSDKKILLFHPSNPLIKQSEFMASCDHLNNFNEKVNLNNNYCNRRNSLCSQKNLKPTPPPKSVHLKHLIKAHKKSCKSSSDLRMSTSENMVTSKLTKIPLTADIIQDKMSGFEMTFNFKVDKDSQIFYDPCNNVDEINNENIKMLKVNRSYSSFDFVKEPPINENFEDNVESSDDNEGKTQDSLHNFSDASDENSDKHVLAPWQIKQSSADEGFDDQLQMSSSPLLIDISLESWSRSDIKFKNIEKSTTNDFQIKVENLTLKQDVANFKNNFDFNKNDINISLKDNETSDQKDVIHNICNTGELINKVDNMQNNSSNNHINAKPCLIVSPLQHHTSPISKPSTHNASFDDTFSMSSPLASNNISNNEVNENLDDNVFYLTKLHFSDLKHIINSVIDIEYKEFLYKMKHVQVMKSNDDDLNCQYVKGIFNVFNDNLVGLRNIFDVILNLNATNNSIGNDSDENVKYCFVDQMTFDGRTIFEPEIDMKNETQACMTKLKNMIDELHKYVGQLKCEENNFVDLLKEDDKRGYSAVANCKKFTTFITDVENVFNLLLLLNRKLLQSDCIQNKKITFEPLINVSHDHEQTKQKLDLEMKLREAKDIKKSIDSKCFKISCYFKDNLPHSHYEIFASILHEKIISIIKKEFISFRLYLLQELNKNLSL